MTAETPRMVIVPAKVTKAMVAAWDDSKPINGKYRSAHCAQGELAAMAAASPNAGKIRRADLKRAFKAAHAAWMARYDPVSPPADELERRQEDALAAALGLQVAEDQEND